jgi:aryl-alcohol dehydrogenase-like predicted oxidoreductase
MQYRRLGRSGLFVSTLTLGTMTFGGKGFFAAAGTTGVEAATRQVDIALDHGVNLLDTSNMYSDGASEEMLGEVLQGGRRERTLIATKVRMPVGPGPNDGGLSRHHLIEQCEASLRRLRTDHIDLYQMHEWDGLTPLEETLEALDSLGPQCSASGSRTRLADCPRRRQRPHRQRNQPRPARKPHPLNPPIAFSVGYRPSGSVHRYLNASLSV